MAIKEDLKVVALAGGVGGAKLAHGLALILPAGQLTVIVNVADDFEHYRLHISPDLDTVMYTLAEIANPVTGWGVVDETWQAFDMMESYGESMWFRLGDRDLATHILRTQELTSGKRLTEVTQRFVEKLGISQHILPVTDDPLRTLIETKEEGTLSFQEYFVKHRWQPTVTALHFDGYESARMTSEVQQALANADLIIICPSNPLLSIAPMLAIQEIREILATRTIPCIAVSPLIGGKAVKGPADKLMRELGLDPSNAGIIDYYRGLIDVLVIDIRDENLLLDIPRISQTSTLMNSVADRQGLAYHILREMTS